MKKSPITIFKEVFGLKEGQGLLDFKKECDELKSHENYAEFCKECADFAGAELDESKV